MESIESRSTNLHQDGETKSSTKLTKDSSRLVGPDNPCHDDLLVASKMDTEGVTGVDGAENSSKGAVPKKILHSRAAYSSPHHRVENNEDGACLGVETEGNNGTNIFHIKSDSELVFQDISSGSGYSKHEENAVDPTKLQKQPKKALSLMKDKLLNDDCYETTMKIHNVISPHDKESTENAAESRKKALSRKKESESIKLEGAECVPNLELPDLDDEPCREPRSISPDTKFQEIHEATLNLWIGIDVLLCPNFFERSDEARAKPPSIKCHRDAKYQVTKFVQDLRKLTCLLYQTNKGERLVYILEGDRFYRIDHHKLRQLQGNTIGELSPTFKIDHPRNLQSSLIIETIPIANPDDFLMKEPPEQKSIMSASYAVGEDVPEEYVNKVEFGVDTECVQPEYAEEDQGLEIEDREVDLSTEPLKTITAYFNHCDDNKLHCTNKIRMQCTEKYLFDSLVKDLEEIGQILIGRKCAFQVSYKQEGDVYKEIQIDDELPIHLPSSPQVSFCLVSEECVPGCYIVN